MDETPVSQQPMQHEGQTQHVVPHKKGKKKWLIIAAIVVAALLISVGVVAILSNKGDNKNSNDNAIPQADTTDAVEKGRLLSNGTCEGEGSKQLTHAPLNAEDTGMIAPYGLMLSDHVTPVDHQYYYQANPAAAKDTYKVYAPADGKIVDVEHHGDDSSREERWRVVISYSCTFFSYYDLMTDYAFKDKLVPNGDVNFKAPEIAVKAGDVIGSVGGQSLDFAVWDTTKMNEKLLYPTAYNNREPWKINTVEPLSYFSDSVQGEILQKYVRTTEPRDGVYAYDEKGKAVGTWFLEGTNGYAGSFDPYQHEGHQGHLSLAYDYIDTNALTVSTGNYQGSSAQFAVSGTATDFKDVTPASGIVKYQLAGRGYQAGGKTWNGSSYATNITVVAGQPVATMLIQMTSEDSLKIEYFPGKTPAEVTAFTAAAKQYNRGQDAKLLEDPGRTP